MNLAEEVPFVPHSTERRLSGFAALGLKAYHSPHVDFLSGTCPALGGHVDIVFGSLGALPNVQILRSSGGCGRDKPLVGTACSYCPKHFFLKHFPNPRRVNTVHGSADKASQEKVTPDQGRSVQGGMAVSAVVGVLTTDVVITLRLDVLTPANR
ncbi:hypothetical protein BaRGS_00036234 [Batillaria attramentaria]|uniref:Uncharacterized protein n=1 Tax=Batillaria attramentaria TaxID=370345 RepID=A0ABD0JBY0_9CAEN